MPVEPEPSNEHARPLHENVNAAVGGVNAVTPCETLVVWPTVSNTSSVIVYGPSAAYVWSASFVVRIAVDEPSPQCQRQPAMPTSSVDDSASTVHVRPLHRTLIAP